MPYKRYIINILGLPHKFYDYTLLKKLLFLRKKRVHSLLSGIRGGSRRGSQRRSCYHFIYLFFFKLPRKTIRHYLFQSDLILQKNKYKYFWRIYVGTNGRPIARQGCTIFNDAINSNHLDCLLFNDPESPLDRVVNHIGVRNVGVCPLIFWKC